MNLGKMPWLTALFGVKVEELALGIKGSFNAENPSRVVLALSVDPESVEPDSTVGLVLVTEVELSAS